MEFSYSPFSGSHLGNEIKIQRSTRERTETIIDEKILSERLEGLGHLKSAESFILKFIIWVKIGAIQVFHLHDNRLQINSERL